MCTHTWPFPLSQALQAAHLHSLCLCRHRDPLSHAKPSLRMQLGAGQTLLQKQHNLLAQQQWKVSRLGRAGCSSSEAGGDWVLHRARCNRKERTAWAAQLSDPRVCYCRGVSLQLFVPSDTTALPTNSPPQGACNLQAFLFILFALAEADASPASGLVLGKQNWSPQRVSCLYHQPAERKEWPQLTPVTGTRSISAGHISDVWCGMFIFLTMAATSERASNGVCLTSPSLAGCLYPEARESQGA